jgi:MFS family permease
MCDAYKLIIYIIIVFSNSVYALAAPFLPVVFSGKDMSGGWVGLIFAMYSISMIIVSPFIGVIVDKVGQTNLLAIGLVAMGTSIMLLGSM